MSSKPSKREKLRGLIEDSRHSVKQLFRSQSSSNPVSTASSDNALLQAGIIQEGDAEASNTFIPLTETPTLKNGSETINDDQPSELLAQNSTANAIVSEPNTHSTYENSPSNSPEVTTTLDSSTANPDGQNQALSLAASPSNGPIPIQSTAAVAFKTSLDVVRGSIGVLPAFRSVADVVVASIEKIPTSTGNRKEFAELTSNLTTSINDIQEHLNQLGPNHNTKVIQDIIGELRSEADYIEVKQKRGAVRKYIDSEQDEDDLSNIKLRLWETANKTFETADKNLNMANENMIEARLAKLRPVQAGRYNSFAATQLQRSGCTPNTRKKILQELQNWANDPQGAKVYWMNGMAGTGKTTIAYSLCVNLEMTHQLAASFFCSRSLPECRDVSCIIPTIAYQLARSCPTFQEVLCQILSNDPDIAHYAITTQFQKLIGEPLERVGDALPDRLWIVVIDALDECSGHADSLLIMDVLLHFTGNSPVKFFVTCRPDLGLQEKLFSSAEFSCSVYDLHDVEKFATQSDIVTYFSVELEPISPNANQIKQLAERSQGLFIHATTIVRYIGAKCPWVDSQKRFQDILDIGEEDKPLDKLYTVVVSAALEDHNHGSREKDEIKLFLDTVVSARESFRMENLAHLLNFEKTDSFQLALKLLHPVLHVDAQNGLVSALHTSFLDYMHNPKRSGYFHCDSPRHSELLARRCFEIMKNLLRFNICDLESSFLLDDDVPGLSRRVADVIPLHLSYACRYWAHHLLLADDTLELRSLLEDFLKHNILFWAEIINLEKHMIDGVLMMSKTYRWMKTRGFPNELCAICQDAQKFVTIISTNVVGKSTPHIYISVMALWNRKDPLWVYYGSCMQGLVAAAGSGFDDRAPAALSVWKASSEVYSVAASQDGRRIASGSRDGTICIWDAYNGAILAGPFKAHSHSICSITFIPGSDLIVSGSFDQTLCVWDATTGQRSGDPFQGHTDRVLSVACSPDGKKVISGAYDSTIRIWGLQNGDTLVNPLRGHRHGVTSVACSSNGNRIASGSYDLTIRIWDAQNGQLLIGPLAGHTSWISSVAYSPDGRRIASGSHDGTIRLWDAMVGSVLAGPFEGHQSSVLSVAYSPDGLQVASCSSDRSIRIWNSHTGQMRTGPLATHTDAVCSVVFMPDGDRVVSGSIDYTIRTWDAHTDYVHTTSSSDGHTREVTSVAFSPDGSRIVSGCRDHSVCIWDDQSGHKLGGPFYGHEAEVESVAISPCNNSFVSGSVDGTLRLYDLQDGNPLTGSLRGHTDAINSVAFSPDGRFIVSASDDCSIRVWDPQTGRTVSGPFIGHEGPVRSVTYLYDESRIVSGSDDYTIRVWDAQTGATLINPLQGHSASVYAVSCSPDGKRIVSGSFDHTICVWDSQSGNMVIGPLTGHTDVVRSVAFSPDGNAIVSGSHDFNIIVWNAQSGQIIGGPFQAHTEWVWSTVFSPNGRSIASSSTDGTIRIWDFQTCISSITPPSFEYWTIESDGWVVDRDSSRLVWIPTDLRTGLKWPHNTHVIHYYRSFMLDFSGVSNGTRWAECYHPK